MKTTCFILSLCMLVCAAQAQDAELLLGANVYTTPEQETHQQLIGYALEVKNALIEQDKHLGKYLCADIFSDDGYPSVGNYPCEAIVHSDQGPIVVRYKNVDEATNSAIVEFLKATPLKDPTYYNNGRFRFSLE